MNLIVRPENLQPKELGAYHTIQKELREACQQHSKWETSYEDRRLWEIPWKLCLLKIRQDLPFRPVYCDFMKLTVNYYPEKSLSFLFEQL